MFSTLIIFPWVLETWSTHEVGGAYGWLRENEWVFHRDNRSIIDDFRSTNCSAWRAARVRYRARRIATRTQHAQPAHTRCRSNDHPSSLLVCVPRDRFWSRAARGYRAVSTWLSLVSISTSNTQYRTACQTRRALPDPVWLTSPFRPSSYAAQHTPIIHKHLHLATRFALSYVLMARRHY